MPAPLDTVFAALADPTRRAILAMLLEDDMAVTDVAEPFEMSLAAISKHLTVLAQAGLIAQEKRGRVKWCKLEPDALRDASIWMQSFGQFEAVNLDAFERFLERELGTGAAPSVSGSPAAPALTSDEAGEAEDHDHDRDDADDVKQITHGRAPSNQVDDGDDHDDQANDDENVAHGSLRSAYVRD